jgi:rRNA processing protein Krr1/Pno1
LRFEAILDGFSMENIQQPSERIHNRILKLLGRCGESREWIEFYQREYTIVYQKLHAEMYLRKFIEEQRKSNSSMPILQIQLPTRQERKLKNLERKQEKHYKHQGRDEMNGR